MQTQRSFTKKLFSMTNERAVEIVSESLAEIKNTPAWDVAWVFLNEDIAEFDADGFVEQELFELLKQFPQQSADLIEGMIDIIDDGKKTAKECMEIQALRLFDVMVAMSVYAKAYQAIYKESQR